MSLKNVYVYTSKLYRVSNMYCAKYIFKCTPQPCKCFVLQQQNAVWARRSRVVVVVSLLGAEAVSKPTASLWLNSDKVSPIVIYRQKTEVYGRCIMNTKMAHFVWWLDGWRTNVHDKESKGCPRVVTDRIKEQVEAKMQEDKHDCTHFYWNLWKRFYIRMSEVLSIFVNYLSLYIFASNLALNSSATTEGRPKDSLWFITNNRPFTIKHEALWTDTSLIITLL